MKIFKNFNKRDNKAEARKKEAEFYDEMLRKTNELLAELEQMENSKTLDSIETRLGILVESKKHKQEVK